MSRAAAFRAAAVLFLCAGGARAGEGLQGVEAALADPALAKAQVSVRIADLKSGRVLFDRSPDLPLVPASNLKVVTAAAALDLLGPAHPLGCELRMSGTLEGGTLRGSLLVLGRGDPGVSGREFDGDATRVLRDWAAALRARGVSEVTGDLLVDDSWFDRALLHPDWPQEQYLGWYMAEIGALSLNDNCLDVTVTGGRHAGEAPAVSWLPRCGLVTVENRARSLAVPRPELDFARGPQDNTIVVKGKIGFGERFTGNVTVHDPGLFFGSALLEVLAGAGIAVRGTVARDPEAGRRDLAKGWTPVAEHRTTLQDAIRVMLKRSQNFYAEMVLKTLGREKGGAGSFEAGARVVTEWLRKSGPAAGAVIVDGSGLSKRNRLSAATLTGVLRRALDGGFLKELVDGLPASGEDGTLEKRLRSDSYRGRVRAKTGWVGGASALSGYVVRGEGDVLVFSMLMNGFSGGNSAAKAVQDRVLVALLGGRGAREDSPGGGRPHSR